MTVKEYLTITRASKFQFFISNNNFEDINVIKEKWGDFHYPKSMEKWIEKEVEQVFVLSNGTLRFFTK